MSPASAFGVDLSSLTAHRAADDAFASARLLIALSAAGSEHVSISLETYRSQEWDTQSLYDDEDLQAAYDLFEGKDYAAALNRVMIAVERSAARSKPDPDPWYVASQIYVRTKRYAEDRELLWRYCRLTIGPSVTITEIEALAASRFGYVAVVEDDDDAEQDSVHSHFMMAQRLVNAEKRVAVVKASPDEARAMTKTRLEDALKALPAENAYQEAAKALRKMFAERVNGDGKDLLEQLHGLAAEHAFLYGTMRLGWQHPANNDHDCGLWVTTVQSLAKPEDRQRVREPYRVIGYQHLPLLTKTDVKRLVVAFGEPGAHEKPRERYADIWASYRRAARAAREQIYGDHSS